MLLLILLAYISILSGGCPQVPQEQPDQDEVTDTLRAACPGSSDAEIRTLLLVIKQDYDDGWTKEEELRIALTGCYNSSCVTCFVAAIDQVWGQGGR
jgi:hypothetical protein